MKLGHTPDATLIAIAGPAFRGTERESKILIKGQATRALKITRRWVRREKRCCSEAEPSALSQTFNGVEKLDFRKPLKTRRARMPYTLRLGLR